MYFYAVCVIVRKGKNKTNKHKQQQQINNNKQFTNLGTPDVTAMMKYPS